MEQTITRTSQTSLSAEALGLLNYLHGILTQPTGSWDGFHRPQSTSMNFALRYQLAFAAYAVSALSQKTPAYRTIYIEALRGAIEKMLHVDVWGYWRVAPDKEDAPSGGMGSAASGHAMVMLAPQRVPVGAPSDPVARNNLQYSGHLSTMLGLYEKVSGDTRYDSPFLLQDPASGVEYSYTHSRVAERIYAQMNANGFGGVCCEQGMAYVPCNNHAMASNTLHDALHGTDYHEANKGWLKTVRGKMVLRGPALRGVFGTAYVKDLHMAAPVAFNFTDAWGLAFMLPFDRPLVRKLYTKFKKRGVSQAGSEGSFVGSAPMSERMEISDVAINTGFGTILAKGVGDLAMTDSFIRYATSAFGATWENGRYFYKDATRTLHATALRAVAEAISPGGADFASLFNDAPHSSDATNPAIARVSDPTGRTGISTAEYNPQDRTLRFTLVLVSDPALLAAAPPSAVEVTVSNVDDSPHIQADNVPSGIDYTRTDNAITFKLPLHRDGISCTVAF